MKINIAKKYLILPVNTDVRNKKVLFTAEDGTLLMEYDVHLDTINPRYFSYVNVERFIGQNTEVTVEPEAQFDCLFADEIPDEGLYRENDRPMIHFSTRCGWSNDPNGLFFANGVYHLFYQHNPVAPVWGNMHWGHAVSRDLVHWLELDDALFPDDMGTIFSGSAYVDSENAGGLKQENGCDPILLYYTAAGNTSRMSGGKEFTQCLAYSLDNGQTFRKYEKNPIIEHIRADNRDPKVSWAPELGKYVLALYLEEHEYLLMVSDDLLHWREFQHLTLGEDSECPDFYPLSVENGTEEERLWVFSGASDYYSVGNLSKHGFEPVQGTRRYYIGEWDSYAAQTFSFPDSRTCGSVYDRRLRIAWDRMHMPDSPFENQMGFPCEVTLAHVNSIYRLRTLPIREIETLYEETLENQPIAVKEGHPFTIQLVRSAYDISIRASRLVNDFTVTIFGVTIQFLPQRNVLKLGKNTIPLSYTGSPCDVRILIDTAGVELFADGGLVYSALAIPADFGMSYLRVEVVSAVSGLEITVHKLKSIWQNINEKEKTRRI